MKKARYPLTPPRTGLPTEYRPRPAAPAKHTAKEFAGSIINGPLKFWDAE